MPSQSTSRTFSSALQIHDLLLRFQRKRRFVSVMHGAGAEEAAPSLNFHEQTILLTLFAEPDRNVSDIVKALQLEQSWVSRIVSSLENRAFVRGVPSPNDRRSKLLKITSSGREVLRRVDVFLAQVMSRMLEPLSDQERKELKRFLDLFADGIGSPRYVPREESHPFDVTMSRITSGLGMLTESVFGSGLNNTQIQIFSVLGENPSGDVQISDIEQLVPYDMSTVSRTVSSFQKLGWIKKERSRRDRRSFRISLTSRGEEKIDEYRSLAEATFQNGVNNASQQQTRSAIQSLKRLTAEIPVGKGTRLEEMVTLHHVPFFEVPVELQDAGRQPDEGEQLIAVKVDQSQKAIVRYKSSQYAKTFDTIAISGTSISLEEMKILLDKVFE